MLIDASTHILTLPEQLFHGSLRKNSLLPPIAIRCIGLTQQPVFPAPKHNYGVSSECYKIVIFSSRRFLTQVPAAGSAYSHVRLPAYRAAVRHVRARPA